MIISVRSGWQRLFIVLAALILCSCFNLTVNAQGSAGVGIRPAIVEDKMDPGEVRQYSVQLNNLSGVDQTYYLSKRDIVGVREGGVPIFAESDLEKTGYEISEWITLDKDQVFIPAEGSAMVNYILSVPDSVSPGSHFGSVIVSVEPPEIRTSGASIGYEVANIISIRVAGDLKELAGIRQFATSQYIYGKTLVDFEARIENEGNTLVKPTGPLEIYNMFGKKVAQLNFNDSQAGVFPSSTREFLLTWEDGGVGFGRYEALLSLGYGEEGRRNTISSTVTFWILPMNIIGPAAAGLLLLLGVVYLGVRLYVKRSIAMFASGSTRRLVRTRQKNQFPVVLLVVTMLAVTSLFLIVLLFLFA
jgi:hypothetical protein